MSVEPIAQRFVEELAGHRSEEELRKIQRYFKTEDGEYGAGDVFMGVRMGQVFRLAKEYIDMSVQELELLLESPVHEVRAGALSIMDKQARRKKTPAQGRFELFDLYIRRLDRINNWDLVDLAAPFVVGGYLFDKPRDILYELARSDDLWARRTAIVSTSYFIRQKDLDDTFTIAEVLIGDNEDLIHKPVGGWLREAGKQDLERLRDFLAKHAPAMARTTLRYATQHLQKDEQDYYRGLR